MRYLQIKGSTRIEADRIKAAAATCKVTEEVEKKYDTNQSL